MSDEALAVELSARAQTTDVKEESSSAAAAAPERRTSPPPALKAFDRSPGLPAHAPSPSGAVGVSGTGPSGGSAGIFAVLVALLLLGPPLLARMLSLSVDLLRPTTLVLQLKRPG